MRTIFLTFCFTSLCLWAVPAVQAPFLGNATTGPGYGIAVATDGTNLVISSESKIDFWRNTASGTPVWQLVSRLNVSAIVTGLAIYKTSAIAKHSAGAFAFELSGGAWAQTQSLALADGTNTYYSHSVSLLNDTLVVGAPNYSSNLGRAYILRRAAPGSPWGVTQVITPGGTTIDFGACVQLGFTGAIPYLLVSAPRAGNYNGGVYAFRDVTGGFALAGGISAPGSGVMRFGEGLTSAGSTVVVAAPANLNFTGTVHIYAMTVNSSGGLVMTMTQTLTPSSVTSPFLFGESLQLTSKELVVAGRTSLTWYPFSSGAAGMPTELPIGAYSNLFGQTVAAVPGLIFAGDRNANSGAGRVLWYY